MKKNIGIIGLILLSSVSQSCKKGGVFCTKGSDNVVLEERVIDGFDCVDLATNADIYILQSDEFSVEVEASDNVISLIETKVKSSCLKIDTKKGNCISGKNTPKIYISLPDLYSISVSGSGDIYLNEQMVGNKLDVNISGSGDIYAADLVLDKLVTRISGSGNLRLSSSDTLNNQQIRISGSGKIESFYMPVKNAEINVSGSGECEINVADYLNARISGSGSVLYKGNPHVDQKITGSGSIQHI
jgi:hypothetical protein